MHFPIRRRAPRSARSTPNTRTRRRAPHLTTIASHCDAELAMIVERRLGVE